MDWETEWEEHEARTGEERWPDNDWETCDICGIRWDPDEVDHSHARRFGGLIIPAPGHESRVRARRSGYAR